MTRLLKEAVTFPSDYVRFYSGEKMARDRIELPTQGFSVPCSTY